MLRCPVCSAVVEDIVATAPCPHCGTPLAREENTAASTFLASDHQLSQLGPLDDARFAPGRIFAARYRIVSLLGRGAMGEVYRADDLKLRKIVALKLLAVHGVQSKSSLDRFVTEVRLARDIAHPNVCRVFDIGEAEGWHYLSMEYVDGETLASLLRRIGRMPPEKALDIARQLCAGLGAAHSVGVLHRDIKPANIMVDGRGRVRLMDFGLAVAAGGSVAGEIAGTAAYMAPEQLAGDRATERTDIYAFGVVLYELFTGQQLFPVRSIGERARIGYDAPAAETSLRGIDPAVVLIIRSCVERDPDVRPDSASAIATALPGGDQLTAAVAEGRLLAPDLVAAAERQGRLHPAVAWPMLGAITLGLVGVAAQIGNVTQLQPSVLPKPPEVLAERAREILAAANYAGRRGDSEFWFSGELSSDPSNPAPNARLHRVRFNYRQSPFLLVPHGPSHVVTDADPAPNVPGMASVTTDTSGRLIRFEAVPEQGKPVAHLAAHDWTGLFTAAGLNSGEFAVVESDRVAPVAHDQDVAWINGEGSVVRRRVTAATMNGAPVYFETFDDSSGEHGNRPESFTGRPPLGEAFFWGAIVAAFAVAAVMARYHLRREEGDRDGARKVGAFVSTGMMLAVLLQAHHVPAAIQEVTLLLSLAGWSLVWGALAWLIYMGLEPPVRRLWPATLISWTRLMSGRVRDPLIGRDVLAGVAVAIGLVGIRFVFTTRPLPNDLLLPALESLRSTRHFASVLMAGIAEAPEFALFPLFFLVITRAIVRSTWLAAIALSALFFPLLTGGAVQTSWALGLYALAQGLVSLTVLLRLGLLAWTTALVVVFVLTRLPLTLDVNSWYFGSSTLSLLLIIGLATYGSVVTMRASVAARDRRAAA
jgi:serine/threonine-protein kinase